MNTLTSLFALALLIGSTASFAEKDSGQGAGNGGMGLLCDGSDEIRLLDYYEWDAYSGGLNQATLDCEAPPLPTEKEGLNKAEIDALLKCVDERLQPLVELDLTRANYYKAEARQFFEDSMFKRNIQVLYTNDANFEIIPKKCHVVNVISQKENPKVEEKKFKVNQDLWDRMSTNDKVGLILHEVIYKDAIQRHHQNSDNVRYFNFIISTENFTNFSIEEYFERAVDSRMMIAPQILTFFDQNLIVESVDKIQYPTTLNFLNKKIKVQGTLHYNSGVPLESYVKLPLKETFTYSACNYDIPLIDGFYINSNKTYSGELAQDISITCDKFQLDLKHGSNITFYEDRVVAVWNASGSKIVQDDVVLPFWKLYFNQGGDKYSIANIYIGNKLQLFNLDINATNISANFKNTDELTIEWGMASDPNTMSTISIGEKRIRIATYKGLLTMIYTVAKFSKDRSMVLVETDNSQTKTLLFQDGKQIPIRKYDALIVSTKNNKLIKRFNNYDRALKKFKQYE